MKNKILKEFFVGEEKKEDSSSKAIKQGSDDGHENLLFQHLTLIRAFEIVQCDSSLLIKAKRLNNRQCTKFFPANFCLRSSRVKASRKI